MFTGYMIGFSIGVMGMVIVTMIHYKHEQELREEIRKLRMRKVRTVPTPILHCTTVKKVKGVMVAENPEEGSELWMDF